jgi:hypothetical protein
MRERALRKSIVLEITGRCNNHSLAAKLPTMQEAPLADMFSSEDGCMGQNDVPPKRRWLRFSLRTLFVLVTIVGGWIGWQMNAARRQKQAVEALERAGANINYDYQQKFGPPSIPIPQSVPGIKPPSHYFDPNVALPGPSWLRASLGDDYFTNVVSLGFDQHVSVDPSVLHVLSYLPRVSSLSIVEGKDIRDDDLGGFAELSELEYLDIKQSKLNGSFLALLRRPERMVLLSFPDSEFDDSAMEYLEAMPNLERLYLNSTRITDRGLVHLQNLVRLEILSLWETKIADEGVVHLRGLKNLKYLGLSHTDISDDSVEPLAEIQSLTVLEVLGTKITREGVRKLRAALPNARVLGP